MANTNDQMIQILRTEMDKQGITDPKLQAGIGAIAGGESGFSMKPETGYSNTANSRIRLIFGSRVANLSDERLSVLKADDVTWFNFIYGGTWGAQNLGNTEVGDGYKFRGRGMFQLTGRSNYERYGKLIGVDITTNPEVANDPTVAAAVVVAYMKDRYRGNGWNGMKRAVGNNIPDIDTTKNQLFNQYLNDGTFGPIEATNEPNVVQSTTSAPAPISATLGDPADEFVESVKKIQTFLISKGLYSGSVDGDFGPESRLAFRNYLG